MSESAPLIYVDLIEDTPLDRQQYGKTYGYTDSSADSTALTDAHKRYLERFQPWRVLIKSRDNHEPLFRSTESYFNKADAIHAAELGFGAGSNVYLRQHEHGNQVLRMAAR